MSGIGGGVERVTGAGGGVLLVGRGGIGFGEVPASSVWRPNDAGGVVSFADAFGNVWPIDVRSSICAIGEGRDEGRGTSRTVRSSASAAPRRLGNGKRPRDITVVRSSSIDSIAGRFATARMANVRARCKPAF